MPGLYGRFNVEVDGNILTASNYNGEHDNHITNATPQQHDDYSANAVQMQAATDPGEVGTESLATSTAGELERLRFAVKEIKGVTQWYESASTSLATISNSASGLAIGLEFEGALGGASSTTDVLAKFINQGGIINAASWSTADVVAADFSTTAKFGNYSYITGAGNIAAFPAFACNKAKGTVCAWTRGFSASDYVMFNRMLGIEVFMSGGSILTTRIQERTAATESTKVTASVTGTLSGNYVTDQASTFKHILAQYRTAGEAGAGTDLLKLYYGGAADGTALTAQTFTGNPGDGGNWIFGSKRNEPATWDHFLANSGLPTAHSDPWTSNGTPNASLSDGVLTIAPAAATGFFSKTGATVLTGVNLAAQTLEFKARISSHGQRAAIASGFLTVDIRDDSLNRTIELDIYKTSVIFGYTDGANLTAVYERALDGTQFHIYRITSSGSPNPTVNLYIDDVLVFSGTNSIVDGTANDRIRFGTTTSTTASEEFEWFAYADEVAAPCTANSGAGFIDSFGIANSVISDALITSLQTNPITSIFGDVPSYGPTLPPMSNFDRTSAINTTYTGTTFADIANNVYYIPSDGLNETEIEAAFTVEGGAATSALFLGIDIDNDITGAAGTGVAFTPGIVRGFSTAGEEFSLSTKRRVLLNPGLHEVRPNWAASSSTIALVDESEGYWLCRVSGTKRLA